MQYPQVEGETEDRTGRQLVQILSSISSEQVYDRIHPIDSVMILK